MRKGRKDVLKRRDHKETEESINSSSADKRPYLRNSREKISLRLAKFEKSENLDAHRVKCAGFSE